MKLVDVNILIYAVNRSDPRHDWILRWWEAALAAEEPVGVCWTVLTGFLRISTNPRAMSQPLSVDEATGRIDAWLAHPNVHVVTESDQHWTILSQLLNQSGGIGNIVTDAHLAALAIGAGCTLASCDTDFARFPQLRWQNPLTNS